MASHSCAEIHHGLSKGTNKRLALAVRLARRDLQRSLASQVVQSYRDDSVSYESTTDRKMHYTTKKKIPATEENGKDHVSLEEREERFPREGHDLAGLKIALKNEVRHLQELCVMEQNGMDQEDEEKDRAAQEVSFMTRKIYDLQQKVNMMNVVGSGKRQRKTGLGAAQRAATRTLRTFSSAHCCLPKQLLELLSHLCRDKQSNDLLSQARIYSGVLETAREKAEFTKGVPTKVDKQKKNHTNGKKSSKPINQLKKVGKQSPSQQPNLFLRPSCTSVSLPTPSLPVYSLPSPPPASKPPIKQTQSHTPSIHVDQQTVEVGVQVEQEKEVEAQELQNVTTVSCCSQHLIPQYKNIQPHLVSMATTLQAMEKKENTIFARWQESNSSPVITNSQKRVQDQQEFKQYHIDTVSLRQGISSRKEWKELSRLADILLDEILTEVCCELDAASDYIALGLFNHEFCGI